MEASGQLNILAVLSPQNLSWYLLNMRLGGPHIWSDTLKRKKNTVPPPGFETQFLSHLAHSLLTTG